MAISRMTATSIGRRKRGGICVHYRSPPPYRHVSLWTQGVRNDGGVGDARGHSQLHAGHAGLRADLASSRQDRLLQIAGDRPKTRLEREVHPQAVRELKTQSPLDISVAGPTLAAHAIRTGLVDEYHLLVVPTLLGGGIRVLPSNVRVKLDLLDERRFANGWVYLRYRTQA